MPLKTQTAQWTEEGLWFIRHPVESEMGKGALGETEHANLLALDVETQTNPGRNRGREQGMT